MKLSLLILALCLAMSLGSAIRVRADKRHVLINRPKIDVFGARERRAAWPGVKGHSGGVYTLAPLRPLELNVRKGEYVCGNRICKLEPGVAPKGCNGVCQYPVQ